MALRDDFRRRYEQRYGVGSSSQIAACEVTMARASAVISNSIQVRPFEGGESGHRRGTNDGALGNRRVYWPAYGAYKETLIYQADALACGQRVSGPAVVEMFSTSVPLHPGQELEIDSWRNLIITLH